MADLQSLLDATTAQERIWAIPGVRRIGFGLKETASEVQPRWVFRVYVDAKKPADELNPEELVPAEVEGFETDVLVDHETSPECGPRLFPGQKISTVAVNAGMRAHKGGTLGCLVQKAGAFSGLTCSHVIDLGNKEEEVFQPDRTEHCESQCNSPVGKAGKQFEERVSLEVEGKAKNYWVDCGLVTLVHGLSFENVLAHGSLAPNLLDLSAPGATTTVEITKQGQTTGLTTGTVVEVSRSENIGGSPQTVWRMISKPVQGEHFSETYDIAADEPTPIAEILHEFAGEPVAATQPDPAGHPRRIHFEGMRFSWEGDSGAIWYDSTGRPVGLHFGGRTVRVKVDGHGEPVKIPTGRGEAAHITAVFSVLGLDPATGIVSGAKTSAGAIVGVPASSPAPPPEIERELSRSGAGRELIADIRGSETEVRNLIDHRRRVTLVWHRRKGPAFVATAINLAREGRTEIPPEVAGARAVDLVGAMLDVLGREGSAELRATVERLRPLLFDLAENCEGLDEVVARLEREPSGVV